MSNNKDMLIEDIISEVVPVHEENSVGDESAIRNHCDGDLHEEESIILEEKNITDTDVLSTITAMINKAQFQADSKREDDFFQKQVIEARDANGTVVLNNTNNILASKKNKIIKKRTQLLKTDVKSKVINGIAETVDTITTTFGNLNLIKKDKKTIQNDDVEVSSNTQRLKMLLPKKNVTKIETSSHVALKNKVARKTLSKNDSIVKVFEENPNTKTTAIIHMKCDKCGLTGQFEDRIKEFGCPQCDGVMKPLAKEALNVDELSKEIRISHEDVIEYQEKIKLATAVVDNIFSTTSQRLSQLESASKMLNVKPADDANNDNRATVKLSEPTKISQMVKKQKQNKSPKSLESHSITKLIPEKERSDINVAETLVSNGENENLTSVVTDSNHRFNELVSERQKTQQLKQELIEEPVEDSMSLDSPHVSKYAGSRGGTTLFEKNKIKSLSLDDDARKRLLSPVNFHYECKDNRIFYLKLMVILLLLLLLLLLYYNFFFKK